MTRDRTHSLECWRYTSHHACAVATIERLQEEVEALKETIDRLHDEIASMREIVGIMLAADSTVEIDDLY
jgi:FtsZ-binding cell division protein ZapB